MTSLDLYNINFVETRCTFIMVLPNRIHRRRKMLAVRGALNVIVCAVRTKFFRQRPIFVKPHLPSTTCCAVMLVYKIFSVVAVKNQMVSHAEHTLKVLIHQISQHDS